MMMVHAMRSLAEELWGLFVDDGAIAAGTLIAVAIVALIGTVDQLPGAILGTLLFVLIWVAMTVSLHRATGGDARAVALKTLAHGGND